MSPKNLCCKWMKKAGKYSYKKGQQGKWPKSTVTEYLRFFNIKGSKAHAVVNPTDADKINEKLSKPGDYLHKIWSLVDCFG